MKRYFVHGILIFFTLIVVACEKPDQSTQGSSEKEVTQTEIKQKSTDSEVKTDDLFRTIEWTDLLPKEDLDALTSPPSYLAEIQDGSLEDQLPSIGESLDENKTKDDPYQRALVSRNIMPEYDGKNVKLPGFIVPLEYNEERAVTQFFLVPYFGACIHVPPPPPNQMLHINYPEGLVLESIYDPFWLSGKLTVGTIENELGVSAYKLKMEKIEDYE